MNLNKFLTELNTNSGMGFKIICGAIYIASITLCLFMYSTIIGFFINKFTKLHFAYIEDLAIFGFIMTVIGLIIYCIISNIISAYIRTNKK